MDLEQITDPTVKKAIEALQANNKAAWFALFIRDAVFTDDGRTLDLESFFDNAFEKQEKFLSIDRVENEGRDLYGNFYAGQWGTFEVYFKFQLDEAREKVEALHIGQTSKL